MRLCANILGRNIYVRFKFSSVRSSHNLCAHAHSLEGTLLMTSSVKFLLSVLVLQNISNGHTANNNNAMNFSTLLFSSIDSIASPGNSFIHSFILNIYKAHLQENYSEALPIPARLKRAVLKRANGNDVRGAQYEFSSPPLPWILFS